MQDIFKKSRIRFDELISDAKSYLSFKYGQIGEIFSPASPFGQLLEVIISLGRLIMFYIEDSITELNLFTASRNSSIRTLARISGHNPTRSIAATGKINIKWNESNPNGVRDGVILIPNWTKIVSEKNGLPYVINLDNDWVKVNLDKTIYSFKIYQGEIESQQVTGTGQPLQSFNLRAKRGAKIDQYVYKVYVNGTEWKPYESIYDIPYEENGYVLKTGIKDGIDLFFGNGFFGKIPELGSIIRIDYLVTNGSFGNIYSDGGETFIWEEPGYNLDNEEVDLSTIFTIKSEGPILFGADEEDIEMTRLMTPLVSKSFVLANENNYFQYLYKYGQWSVIEVFNTFGDENIADDNIIYIFLVPDVSKRILSNQTYFSINKDLFGLSPKEKEMIYDLIDQSGQKIITSEVVILDPIITEYVLNINIRAFAGYPKENIWQETVSRVSQYFLTNKRRDKIPKSDIISILEGIKGIDSVNAWFISKQNEDNFILTGNDDNVGLDDFGDINIKKNELPIIRGGWYDRNGVFYQDGAFRDSPCSINIYFSKTDANENSLSNLQIMNKKTIKNV